MPAAPSSVDAACSSPRSSSPPSIFRIVTTQRAVEQDLGIEHAGDQPERNGLPSCCELEAPYHRRGLQPMDRLRHEVYSTPAALPRRQPPAVRAPMRRLPEDYPQSQPGAGQPRRGSTRISRTDAVPRDPDPISLHSLQRPRQHLWRRDRSRNTKVIRHAFDHGAGPVRCIYPWPPGPGVRIVADTTIDSSDHRIQHSCSDCCFPPSREDILYGIRHVPSL